MEEARWFHKPDEKWMCIRDNVLKQTMSLHLAIENQEGGYEPLIAKPAAYSLRIIRDNKSRFKRSENDKAELW